MTLTTQQISQEALMVLAQKYHYTFMPGDLIYNHLIILIYDTYENNSEIMHKSEPNVYKKIFTSVQIITVAFQGQIHQLIWLFLLYSELFSPYAAGG